MTTYLNPSTRNGGVEQIVVPERQGDNIDGKVITGNIIIGAEIEGAVVTGSLVRTAADGARWELSGDGEGTAAQQWLKAYSGMPDETYPGGIETSIAAIDPTGQSGTTGALRLFAPQRSSTPSNAQSALTLYSGGTVMLADGSAGGVSVPEVQLDSTAVFIEGKDQINLVTGSRGSYGDPDPNYKGALIFADRGGNVGINGDVETWLVGGPNGYGTNDATLSLKPDSVSLTQGGSSALTMGGNTTKLIGGSGQVSEVDLWSGGTVNIISGANLHMGPRGGLGNIYLKTQFAWVQPDVAAGADPNSTHGLIIGDYSAGRFGEPSLRIRRRTSDDTTTTEAYTYVIGGTGSAVATLIRRAGVEQNRFTLDSAFASTTKEFRADSFTSAKMRPQDTGTVSFVHTTTSTTEVDNTGGPALTFVAPPSGMVKFLVSCYPKSGAAGTLAEVGIRVRSGATIGSGTQMALEYIASSYVDQYLRLTGFATVDGLTPGATYNARLTLRTGVAGTTATNSQSRILAEACM